MSDLKGIKVDASGVTIGAMTTHAAVADSAAVQKAIPALAELAAGIGDPMVRNMGTIGGSVANADPAACYPAALLGLGATVHTDRRTIAADAFFTGLYETALQPGELITAVSFPLVRQPRRGRCAGCGDRCQGQRVPRQGDGRRIDREFHRCCGQGRQRSHHRHQCRHARLGGLPRRDDHRDDAARRHGGTGALRRVRLVRQALWQMQVLP